jgi:transposase
MKALYARPPTEEERKQLEAGLKSTIALTVRRCQMIMMSVDERLKVDVIGQRVGRSGQTVRDVLNTFNEAGIGCIYPQKVGRQDDQRTFGDAARERLRAIIVCSPREFGYETSLWTLDLLAEVSYAQGLTAHCVHKDTVSETLRQMGMPWKRAKRTIRSPDPHYAGKKTPGLAKSVGSSPSGVAFAGAR